MRPHIFIAALTLLCACSNDETNPETDPEVTPDADACEHFEGGPFADGPALTDSHTAYTIALTDGAAALTVTIDEGAEWFFFTDEALPFTIADSGGQELALEESCDAGGCSADCSVVQGRHVVDIDAVGTYDIALGPSDHDTVRLVYFPSAEHDHEHE